MHSQLCTDVEDCEIASEVPDCSEVYSSAASLNNTGEFTDKTFYNIVKREIGQTRRNSTVAAKPANMKIRVYTRISKKLGMWDPKLPRSENIKVLTMNELIYY